MTLTQSLRSPPVVVREIQKTNLFRKHSEPYSEAAALPPCDGPPVRYVYHQGDGHSEGGPGDCVQCGVGVAKVLDNLGVGKEGVRFCVWI